MNPLALTITAATLAAVALPATAANGPWDRLEDRLDRRESYLDRQVTHGLKDRIEDWVDRVEDRRDRADKPVPAVLRRWERRSIIRRLGN